MEALKKVWATIVSWVLLTYHLVAIGLGMFWDDVKKLWWKCVYYPLFFVVYTPINWLAKFLINTGRSLGEGVAAKLRYVLIAIRMKW